MLVEVSVLQFKAVGLNSAGPHPYVLLMSPWKPTSAKTKTELREILAQAVRNTQPKPEPKPKKDRREIGDGRTASLISAAPAKERPRMDQGGDL